MRKQDIRNSLLRDRRGVVAVIVTIMLPVFIGFAALAIDMSYARWTRTELQHTASAAALAGVLDLTDALDPAGVPDTDDYRKKAVEYAYKNMPEVRHGRVLETICGTYVTANETVTGSNECADVKAGNWNPATRTFTPWDEPFDPLNNPDGFDPSTMDLDAVQVYTHRSQTNGNPLNLFLAAVVGLAQTDVNTQAVAWGTGGGGATNCYEDGILAGGYVTLGSDGVFVNDFCIYGREGVTFVSGPVIEEGAQIGSLGSAFCTPDCSDCGAQCGTIDFESHECYVPRDTYLYMPPEDCDAACAAAHDGYADRLEWLLDFGYCDPMEPAMAAYGLDLQPEQANDISTIIDGIKIGDPPQITNVVIIGDGSPGPISFEMENFMTSEIRNLQGYTLPPPGDIVPGTAYIINGNFYVDNEIYNLTNVIVAVRGNAYFDGGAFRNTAPCEGDGNYKLGFYATEDLYVRDVATGVDLIGGNDVLIGENFNEFEPGPHDVSIQAGNDVFIDEDGHYLRCPDRIKSYGEETTGPYVRLVD